MQLVVTPRVLNKHQSAIQQVTKVNSQYRLQVSGLRVSETSMGGKYVASLLGHSERHLHGTLNRVGSGPESHRQKLLDRDFR